MFLALLLAMMPAHAEQIQYLPNAPATLAAMYETIQAADQTLELAYYEISPCDTSVKVLMKLMADRKKARPNLTVRILADDYPLSDAGLSASEFARKLRSQRLNFRVFNPHGVIFNPRYDHRFHAKYMVADAGTNHSRLVTGSTNLADTHFGMSRRGVRGASGVNYIDRNVLVSEGDSAQTARVHFNEIWDEAADPSDRDSLPRGCFNYGDRESALENFIKANHEALLRAREIHKCADAEFVADSKAFWTESNPFEHQGGVGPGMEAERARQVESKPTLKATLEILKSGNQILIENFTYMPFYDLETVINEKIKARQLTVYTNHYRGSKEPFERLHNTYVGDDSRRGAKIYSVATIDQENQHWDFTPNSVRYQNHSKVFVSRRGESSAVSIGSFNLDARSYLLNIESGIFAFGCESLTREVEQTTRTLTDSQDADQATALRRRMKGYVESPVPDKNQALWDLLNIFHQL